MKTEIEWLNLYAAREKATYPFPVGPGWLFKEIEAETLRDVLKLTGADHLTLKQVHNALKTGLELLENGRRDVLSGCPCLFTSPCSPDCSCANQAASGGCSRCASTGSPEQRANQAAILAACIDEHIHEYLPKEPEAGPEELG